MNNVTNVKVPTMGTIRQVAKLGFLPEHRLRILTKQGKLPGLYCGKKFLVNVDKLIELLDAGEL